MKMINLTNRNTIKGPKWEKFQNGYARHSPIYAYVHSSSRFTHFT
jgi:hypothetical protein